MREPTNHADTEALLAHAGWVKSLASSLGRDSSHAADLEQQTWLRVLENPPLHGGNLRGWLGRVLGNSKRQLQRGDARRVRREAEHGTEGATSSTLDLVAQAEMQREVVAIVLDLEEPYRGTILQRYWQERSPMEIAKAEGLSAGTVRSRLHRAHDMLRQRLAAEHEADGRDWYGVLLGTQGTISRQATLGAAAGVGPAFLLGWPLKVGAAVLLAACLAWWAGSSGAGNHSPEGGEAGLEIAQSAPLDTGPADTAKAALDPPAAAQLRQSTAQSGEPAASLAPRIEGTVSTPGGSPIANASIALHALDAEQQSGPWLAETRSDANGGFRLQAPRTSAAEGDSSYLLIAGAANHRSVSKRVGRGEGPVKLSLSRLGNLTGQVRDALTGQGIADVLVTSLAQRSTRTDSAGRYSLEGLSTGRELRVYARVEGYAEGRARVLLREMESEPLDFQLERGVRLPVRVHDRDTGAPIEGAVVRGDPNALPLGTTDDQGGFQLRILHGRELYLQVKADGYVPFVWNYKPQSLERSIAPQIPLEAVAIVAGIVRGSAGKPVSGVGISIRGPARGFGIRAFGTAEREAYDLPGMAGSELPLNQRFVTDAGGAFRIPVLPGPGEHRVAATRKASPTVLSAPFLVGSSSEAPWVEVTLRAGATVQGQVRFQGQPQAGVRVRWRPVDGGDGAACESDGSGNYRLEHVPAGAHHIEVVSAHLGSFGALPRIQLVVRDGGTILQDLEWSAAIASISGQVLGSDGKALGGVEVDAKRQVAKGTFTPSYGAQSDPDGSYSITVPAQGVYSVTAGVPPVRSERRDVLPDQDCVDFVLRKPGRLVLQLVDSESRAPIQGGSEVRCIAWREASNGPFRATHAALSRTGRVDLTLPQGRVDLSIFPFELGLAPVRVSDVEVGEDPGSVPLVVPVEKGVSAQLALAPKPDSPGRLGGHLIFLVHESQADLIGAPNPPERPKTHQVNGNSIWMADPAIYGQRINPDDQGHAFLQGLTPGSYSVVAFPPDLVFEPGHFQVGFGLEGPIRIQWKGR